MNGTKAQKRDDLLVEFIMQHRGRNNCVSSKTICEFLGDRGYKTPPTSLYPMIHRLMYERNLPICYVSMKGYYLAVNEDDITTVIADLQTRMGGFQRHIEFLEKHIGGVANLKGGAE